MKVGVERMTKCDMALARLPVIVVGLVVLTGGCERTSQTDSRDSARTANAQTADESPVNVDPTARQHSANSQRSVPVTAATAEEAAEPVAGPGKEPTAGDNDASDTKVIAYYFHRTMRCPTCLSIEQQAREAVETAYSEELNSGKLEWHAVNIEEEGNEHFESDFELSSSSLVIVQMDGDDVAAWKSLERVWELVEDPLGFQEYVWNELTEFLPG